MKSPTNDRNDKNEPAYVEVDQVQEKKSCCSKKVWGIVAIVVGLIVLGVGILFGAILPGVVDDKIMDGALTCDAEELSDQFNNPDGDCEDCVPFYYGYYPFDVENAMEVMEGKEDKFKVQEKGPYVYRRFTNRMDVNFEGEFIQYKTYNTWSFVAEKSCDECLESDMVTMMDIGYMRVMTGAGGEKAFVERLLKALLQQRGIEMEPEVFNIALDSIGQQVLRVLNGIGSLNVPSMLLSAIKLQGLLSADIADPSALQTAGALFATPPLTGIHHSGAFVQKTVRQYALGAPSFIAGAGATASLSACQPDGPLGFCAACDAENPSEQCLASIVQCQSCATAKKVVELNDKMACPALKNLLMEVVDEAVADTFVNATCKKCNTGFMCLAPLPGQVSGSSINYMDFPPQAKDIPSTTLNTGCQDVSKVAEYKVFEGITANALWKMDAPLTRNPSAIEMAEFSQIRHCGPNKNDKVNCVDITGSDGTSFPPAGASISGLKSTPNFDSIDLYVPQARQNVTVFDSNTDVQVEETTLRRFRVSDQVLYKSPYNQNKGTGVPVNGVQNLAYNIGALAYVSFPFFMFGESSLFENIDLYHKDGKKSTFYTPETIPQTMYDTCSTFLDIEPATGKTFNARKRLMASFAIATITNENATSILDYSKAADKQANIIVPAYWGEEYAIITPHLASKFSSVQDLGNSFLPVLLVGIALAIILFILAFCCFRKQHRRS